MDHISKTNNCKNRKIEIAFVSEHCATIWTKNWWQLFFNISLTGNNPKIDFSFVSEHSSSIWTKNWWRLFFNISLTRNNPKIDLSFVSEHYSSIWTKKWKRLILRGRVCISLTRTGPIYNIMVVSRIIPTNSKMNKTSILSYIYSYKHLFELGTHIKLSYPM